MAKNFSSGGRSVSPADAMKAHNRFQEGLSLHQHGQLKEAQIHYERALKSQPDHFDALHMLALITYQLQQTERAEILFLKVMKLDPDAPHVLNNFGNVLLDLKKYKSALVRFDRALALDPNYAEAHSNRGDLMQNMGRWDEALASYDRAIELSPNNPIAYYNRGNAFNAIGRFDEAVKSYEQALAIAPNYAEAYANRGNALQSLKRYREAVASFDQALEFDPKIPYMLGTRLHTCMQMCDWRLFDQRLAQMLEGVSDLQPTCQPFPILSLTSDPLLQQKAAQLWIHSKYPSPRVPTAFAKRKSDARLRVGYFSADFCHHPVAHLIAGLFEAHDRSRFEIFAFSSSPNTGDKMRMRLEKGFDHFMDVKAESDTQIVARARELALDIAVDLSGLTTGCRPGIFAARVAPIQINYLGHPGTMGASYIDYILADTTVIKSGTEHFYSEKIIYLPDSYQPNDHSRSVSTQAFSRLILGLPAQAFVFCCFNNNYKITPDTFDRWMTILSAVPESVLWLLEASDETANNLRREAQQRGVAPERLVFAPQLPMDQHLARQKYADLFLDSAPYNAHTTASDALWVGLPVLTLMQDAFASRVAASLLRAVALPELVTEDPAVFVSRAIELATDTAQLKVLRDRLLASRLQAPLFDIKRFARGVEEAYLQVNARQQAGQAAASIHISL